ncbi:MAG: FecR domain-containing protein [Spirochaetes bacterium]|nr:FecR domain-containing protein [Spirochaetota bacterium]
MKKYTGAVFTVLLLFVLPLPLSSAVVDWVTGEVAYSHYKDEWKEVELGMNLGTGDIVKTGIASEAVLLEQGGEIHILENSQFTLSERIENEKQKPTLMLFLGRMKFKLGKGAVEEPEVRTQTVNLAIRGTEFEVGSGFDGSTLVLLSEGSVAVRGKTSELVLIEGEGTEVGFGEEPKEKFRVLERVIDWDEWFTLSEEAVKGNELMLLTRMMEKFDELSYDINEYEKVREEALGKKEALMTKRDESVESGETTQASEYAKEANAEGKTAFHAIINIRFLALSSIGLYDMAERIYTGMEKPSDEVTAVFEKIKAVYGWIEKSYLREGDRERLEETAEKRKGCLTLF